MIDSTTLRTMAAARLEDAQVLLDNGRFDGSAYVCGYAVEFSLKARICDTLNWSGYPENQKEFKGLSCFKVHDFDILLLLSGRDKEIQNNFLAHWSIVKGWKPEQRYGPVGKFSDTDARAFLQSAIALIQQL